MKKIIFATGNQDKMREIREILADMDVEVVSMKEAGIHADIVENGSTFEENAVIKAKTICELTGEITLADDSGSSISLILAREKAPENPPSPPSTSSRMVLFTCSFISSTDLYPASISTPAVL